MFERFTDRARRSVVLAQEEARRLRHNDIGTEHLLLGLVREGEGVASHELVGLGADLDRVREAVIWMLRGYSAERESEMAAPSPRPFEVPRRVPPLCPNCSEVLSNTLAVRVVETAGEDEPIAVKIAYCSRCGVALGTVS